MRVIHEEAVIDLDGEGGMADITKIVMDVVRKSGIREGLVNIFSVGSTAGVTTIEYEDGLIQDFRDAVERLFPRDIEYRHNLKWRDYNGHSHIRASFIKPSLTIPVVDGVPVLGTWQQIVLINFDNRPRSRKIIITCMGV